MRSKTKQRHSLAMPYRFRIFQESWDILLKVAYKELSRRLRRRVRIEGPISIASERPKEKGRTMAESFEKKIGDESQDFMDSENFDLSDDALDAIAGGALFTDGSGNPSWDTYMRMGYQL